ncbi:hypothetical protein J3458_003605 [Metarhizium acridum]|uniref:uncharacterized protein n=1 Tax=Metarhizium acridum TaxID=92637 RepID=UPI001C6B7204|nr:hypothetical protein J3458_003605 [Metarhizium acridum]
MLPAFFIVPYIQFTFGFEAIAQALRPYQPFSPRPKWSVPTYLAVIVFGLILTYVLTRLEFPPNFCFPSLVFFLRRWAIGCFGLLVGIAATLLIGSVATFVRLYRVVGIGEQQRITATWMAWFMALGALTLSIMAPFFYSVAVDGQSRIKTTQSELSMATVVVSNLTGLMTGGMYILLRSSKIGKLGPKGYFEFDRKRSIRHPKSSPPHSFIFTRQMKQPVPLSTQLPPARRQESSLYTTQDVELGLGPVHALTSDEPPKPDGMAEAFAVGVATTTPGPVSSQEAHPRKNSTYNIFPRDTVSDKPMYTLPATAYMTSSKEDKDQAVNPFDDELLPPPTIRLSGSRHNRESSLGTSATVPIGIRVSNINDMPSVQSYYEVPPSPRAMTPTQPVSSAPVPQIPDTLAISEDEASEEDDDKQLPPVPLALLKKQPVKEVDEEEIRLSPTVYSPQRTPSKTKTKASSPTARPVGPTHSPESFSPVNEAEWI